jgi:hypothetical protein
MMWVDVFLSVGGSVLVVGVMCALVWGVSKI